MPFILVSSGGLGVAESFPAWALSFAVIFGKGMAIPCGWARVNARQIAREGHSLSTVTGVLGGAGDVAKVVHGSYGRMLVVSVLPTGQGAGRRALPGFIVTVQDLGVAWTTVFSN